MSTIDAITSAQQQLSSVTSNTAVESAIGGAAFEKALDYAMGAKDLVLPTPVSAAIDIGVDSLDIDSLLPSENASIQNGVQSVFQELSVGIATSFVSALSGADSATALATDTASAPSETDSGDDKTQSSLISKQNILDTKNIVETIAPLLPETKATKLATVMLSTLEDLLLDEAYFDEYD